MQTPISTMRITVLLVLFVLCTGWALGVTGKELHTSEGGATWA